jgi:4-alpha-glucanotransferase
MRKSGILLHITSLPSPFGIGDLGTGAYAFADFLSRSRQKIWQVLPLNPTDPASGNSPYSSVSTFAGNTLLISPEMLLKDGLLDKKALECDVDFPASRTDYHLATRYKEKILLRAYEKFCKTKKYQAEFHEFYIENADWLNNFSAYIVIKRHYGGKAWNRWDKALREHDRYALHEFHNRYADEIRKEQVLQYFFHKQWFALKKYCNAREIELVGDMPIYVNYDSVSVWANKEVFKLDSAGYPSFIAGVPPDYFSQTGQLWGCPVYNWEVLKAHHYEWWIRRLSYNLKLCDRLRLDHFRGFVAFWEVPAGEVTAVNGHWEKTPADDFFTALTKRIPQLPIIAEDLGLITQDVKDLMAKYGFPGMRILQFAFFEDNPEHPYLPQNFIRNCVVYTGTHDNNTTRGWFAAEVDEASRARIEAAVGGPASDKNINRELIALAMHSIASTAIFPLQDVLNLGAEARMNLPGTGTGNWEWRLLPEHLTAGVEEYLAELTQASKRV